MNLDPYQLQDLNSFDHDQTFKNSNFQDYKKVQFCEIDLFNQYENETLNFPKIKVQITEKGICLKSLITDLNEKYQNQGMNSGNLLSYFDPIRGQGVYVYFGKCPILEGIFAPREIIQGGKIFIKSRTQKMSLVDQLIKDQTNKEELYKDQNQLQQSGNSKQRVKERTISEVIEKVALWRKLYTGFVDEQGYQINMSLDAAADKVGISKKTLDDYLLQIRQGKKYGFNFNEKKNEKIGSLRSFVKEKKEKNGEDHQD